MNRVRYQVFRKFVTLRRKDDKINGTAVVRGRRFVSRFILISRRLEDPMYLTIAGLTAAAVPARYSEPVLDFEPSGSPTTSVRFSSRERRCSAGHVIESV